MESNIQVFNFSKIVGRVSREGRNIFMRGLTNKFLNKCFGPKSRNPKRFKWDRTNKLQFFKNCRLSKSKNLNISRRGQTNKILNKFFCPESRESRNVSNGVEQTSFQFFKNCRPSKSKKSKHIYEGSN